MIRPDAFAQGLAHVRAAVLAAHPYASSYRGGGAGRCMPIAQVLADRLTPAGQAVLDQWEEDADRDRTEGRVALSPCPWPISSWPCGLRHPKDPGRNADRRVALKVQARRRDAEDFAAARADAVARLTALSVAWDCESAAAEWRRSA